MMETAWKFENSDNENISVVLFKESILLLHILDCTVIIITMVPNEMPFPNEYRKIIVSILTIQYISFSL